MWLRGEARPFALVGVARRPGGARVPSARAWRASSRPVRADRGPSLEVDGGGAVVGRRGGSVARLRTWRAHRTAATAARRRRSRGRRSRSRSTTMWSSTTVSDGGSRGYGPPSDPRFLDARLNVCGGIACMGAPSPRRAASRATTPFVVGRQRRGRARRPQWPIAGRRIEAGELSRRTVRAPGGECDGDPLDLFARALPRRPAAVRGARRRGRQPFPERFLRAIGADVWTEPIKGTRPRTGSPSGRIGRRDSLVTSSKDAAEHVMIVDLMRNDSAGCAVRGGTASRPVEGHAGVWHLVSTVPAGCAKECGDGGCCGQRFLQDRSRGRRRSRR